MSFARNYHRWILDEFAPYLGDAIAEVGAGRGDVSSLLRERQIKRLVAFEPSANLFAQLQREIATWPSAVAVNGIFDPAAVNGQVDAVLYLNVLEHIEDDAAELSKAQSALRPGGHLLIFVPALRWLYSDFDRSIGHFRRYRRRELSELVEQAGFEIAKLRYFDIAGVLPWYVTFVLMHRTLTGGGVATYDRWVVPIMRRIERWIRPPIGKNLLLVARRPERTK
jgi:SAM-dependent methyltransferase